MPEQVLTTRELNRTYLQRQHLLQRSTMSTEAMLSALVGLQGQVTKDPYLALWSRIEDFQHDHLSDMLHNRTAVRSSLLRGTIHVVTADDFIEIFPVTFAHHQRVFPQLGSGSQVPAEIVDAVLERSREHLSDNPMTTKKLVELLTEEWPDAHQRGLGQVSRFLLPLIQTTPRGIWGKGQAPTWALASEWLNREIPEEIVPPHDLLHRYLRAFGPASVADMTLWSGLTNLKPVVEDLIPDLKTYTTDNGTIVYDAPGLDIADEDTPAPVRFLPGFDNALLAHKDRSRIIADHHHKRIIAPNGLSSSTFLVDGFVAGSWRAFEDRLELTAFDKLPKPQQREVEREAAALSPFWAGGDLPIVWIDL